MGTRERYFWKMYVSASRRVYALLFSVLKFGEVTNIPLFMVSLNPVLSECETVIQNDLFIDSSANKDSVELFLYNPVKFWSGLKVLLQKCSKAVWRSMQSGLLSCPAIVIERLILQIMSSPLTTTRYFEEASAKDQLETLLISAECFKV